VLEYEDVSHEVIDLLTDLDIGCRELSCTTLGNPDEGFIENMAELQTLPVEIMSREDIHDSWMKFLTHICSFVPENLSYHIHVFTTIIEQNFICLLHELILKMLVLSRIKIMGFRDPNPSVGKPR